MSSLAFLVTELQSLSSETRRKHPEIREAAERSLAILRASPEQATASLASDGPKSEDLLRPVFMGCATKNPKVVAISLGSLQRLIALKAVPQSAVSKIVEIMSDAARTQGVDIQLKVLQTLVSLVPGFDAVRGELLGDALLVCFKLQESRIAVVSSTAAATLRQLVMFVVDKMVLEDRIKESRGEDEEEIVNPNGQVDLPNGKQISLLPSARDAFMVFQDLCLLANAEPPLFLKLDHLHKTFALELVESVLTNYHGVFRQHPELILLLQHLLCPLLIRSLSEKPNFPLSLRCTRVVFLLLKQFSNELTTETEVFLSILVRIISDESSEVFSDGPSAGPRPTWMRVMAMEIMRGLCADADLVRQIWTRYDAQNTGSQVLTSLVSALKRVVTERPSLLGVSTQMGGVGVPHESPIIGGSAGPGGQAGTAAYGIASDVAGRVASAAATVSGVVGMIPLAGGAGLSVQTASMKLQCIDQLDKADAPQIPETYIYLLAVQCIVSLCEGFAAFVGPLYTSIIMARPRVAGEAVIRAPPALDLSKLSSESTPSASSTSSPASSRSASPTPTPSPSQSKVIRDAWQIKQLHVVHSIISQAWPALLAALSFIISTNISDDIFVNILLAYQAMTNVSGMLGLTTPRDAFFTSLGKFAVPGRVVTGLETWVEPPPTPRSATAAISEGLGLTAGGATQPPGLSERNLACLKVVVGCAMYLAGGLGEAWYAILDTLQNADYVLTVRGAGGAASGLGGLKRPTQAGLGAPQGRVVSLTQSVGALNTQASATTPRNPLLSDLDHETTIATIQRLFDASKNLEDEAFRDFVNALCRLSSEMVGLQSGHGIEFGGGSGFGQINESVESFEDSGEKTTLRVTTANPRMDAIHRRRLSGIHIPKIARHGDFGISKLGGVSMLNIHRLIYRSPDIAWEPITKHLLSILRLPTAPQPIRIQAARVLDEILLVVPRNITNTAELQAAVQRRVLEVLAQQVIPDVNAAPSVANTTTGVELRKMGLETLHSILQASGHTLVVGWEVVFKMLESVCRPAERSYGSGPRRSMSTETLAASTTSPSIPPSLTSSPEKRTRPLPVGFGLGNPSEKGYSGLVKIAFQSLTLVCDSSVSTLSPAHLRLCISTLAQFGKQADTNIALTAAASLLWSVSDAIQAKRKNVDEEPEYSEIWMFLLGEVLGLTEDGRAEVRDGAIQTLFRTMQLYGATLSLETWDQCIWKIMFPVLEKLSVGMRMLASGGAVVESQEVIQAWDDSKTLAFSSIGSLLGDFLVSKIMLLDQFTKAWDTFVGQVEETILVDNRCVSAPALRCLDRGLKAASLAEGGVLKVRVLDMLERVWKAIDTLGSSATRKFDSKEDLEASPHRPFTQESFVAFVDVVQSARRTGKAVDNGKEWSLERLARMMQILKGVLTYPHSPDYRPDIDGLPPVQSIVMDTIKDIDLSVPGAPSLVMRDLSEYSTLPFLAAFDAIPPSNSTGPGSSNATPPKRVTYIALAKRTMPLLVELYQRFKDTPAIYIDGTVEAVLSSYSVPIKLKYECPAPSKFGNDLPLWKTATSSFLLIIKECTQQIHHLNSELSDENLEGLWRQILDVFKGGLLADCSPAESFPLEVQEAEENFDLALVASLEIDVVPHLGHPRVPDGLVAQLGKILHHASRLYDGEDPLTSLSSPTSSISTSTASTSVISPASSSSSSPIKVIPLDIGDGSSMNRPLLPRERFSYWCFDVLFLICSSVTHDQEASRRRLAAFSLPSLLNRCRSTLVDFVADQSLRGNFPFPRAREEELLYVLNKLLRLRLWPGSLWAAMSDDPSRHAVDQPQLGNDLAIPATPQALIADSIKRSTVGHLFHFYPILCEISALPKKVPSAWISAGDWDYTHGRKEAIQKLGHGEPKSPSQVHAQSQESVKSREVDARSLARDCLRELGKEMGVSA